MRCDMDVA